MNSTKIAIADIYPTLFHQSDNAALMAQKTFFRLFQLHLFILILIPALGLLSGLFPKNQNVFSAITGTLLVFDVVVTFIIRGQKYEQAWFDCRSVAESVKSCTWRYMMGVPPYLFSLPDIDVDSLFLRNLEDILLARQQITGLLTSSHESWNSVTGFMRHVRSLSLRDRMDFYFKHRLQDQRIWYQSKSFKNRSRASVSFWIVVFTEILTVGFVVVSAYYHWIPSQLIGFLVTITAAFTARDQAKRYEELTSAYGLAAQELGNFEAMFHHITQEDQFHNFVTQVEDAISREHTMWFARRTLMIRPISAGRGD